MRFVVLSKMGPSLTQGYSLPSPRNRALVNDTDFSFGFLRGSRWDSYQLLLVSFDRVRQERSPYNRGDLFHELGLFLGWPPVIDFGVVDVSSLETFRAPLNRLAIPTSSNGVRAWMMDWRSQAIDHIRMQSGVWPRWCGLITFDGHLSVDCHSLKTLQCNIKNWWSCSSV